MASGADALGFNFFTGSTRYISPEKAAEICAQVPAFVATVGLFVNEPIADVNRIIASLRLGLVQFHDDETPEYCAQIQACGISVIKVFHMDETFDLLYTKPYENCSDLFLFDLQCLVHHLVSLHCQI